MSTGKSKRRGRSESRRSKIESIRHEDKRKNIPTEELRDFVTEEVQQPKTVLYPRDSSLDPQLVWKGKDEQDQQDLAVPAVPIYIQEKIHPHAIIEDFRRSAVKPGRDPQLTMFDDFNGLPEDFDKRVDFYQYDANWSNRMILGDSLFVMNSLAEKENLRGQVQMIYLDPPYGINFASNWQVSTRKREVKDNSEGASRQPEQVKAFRDTWKLGIHSYLAYLRDRLAVARDLLTESGSIFVQIGDENLHLVRSLLDEIFGAKNFIAHIGFKKKKMPLGETYIFTMCDYLIWYGKNATQTKFRRLYIPRDSSDAGDFNYIESEDGRVGAFRNGDISPRSRRFQSMDLRSSGRTESCVFEHTHKGRRFVPSSGKSWKTNPQGMSRLHKSNRLFSPGDSLRVKFYLDEYPVQELSHMWMDTQGATDKHYVVETATKVAERCLLMTTDPGDLVLDPTCGSATTAYVAQQWGRRWITIDSSRVAMTLARTRLIVGRFPYYVLSDTPEGIDKQAELVGRVSSSPRPTTNGDIRKGFVYKRVPHVTLKAIANNEEIDAIDARWQEALESIREKLNRLLKQKWEEWEVPREAGKDWPKEARELLADWWENRRKRQREIDDSIARRADTETLYDQPYQDKKRIRVTGPFTVESLSPHRTISVQEKHERAESFGEGRNLRVIGPDRFSTMILDNLRKAGVQNTKKNERLKFDSLEPYAGEWIHGEGHYTESDGKQKRAAICIGPEFGTVGKELVKEAAKEAVRGIGFDVLIVCGFAFDPHVSEEAKRYGKLVVLPTKMNPDLAMGDELLKKTGAGNLFMVFGEPDVDVRTDKDGKLTVEIRGLDVYDPTTGEIRSSSTDDIACWFIDTNYNDESFFVRHAYFTGADEPYEKLKRALRAEIDEAAWSQLYTTTSRPFDKPDTGKIAIKVINHYGDEVLKVYDLNEPAS